MSVKQEPWELEHDHKHTGIATEISHNLFKIRGNLNDNIYEHIVWLMNN